MAEFRPCVQLANYTCMFYQTPALNIWNDSSVARFTPRAWNVVIECVPITLIADQQEGACWVFDRQLMVHEALGRDISENPQVPAPWFPSPPLTAPIKPHTPASVSVGTLSDMIYRSVRFMSAPERWQTIKNRRDGALTAAGQWCVTYGTVDTC